MKHTQAYVETAIQHVKELEQRVVEQRARVDRLRAEDQPTEAAENLLATLRESLALMLVHLGRLTDPARGGNVSN